MITYSIQILERALADVEIGIEMNMDNLNGSIRNDKFHKEQIRRFRELKEDYERAIKILNEGIRP